MFNWQAPSLFSGNLEDETNIHNFFNPYFDYGYMSIFLILPLVLVSIWLEFTHRWLPYGRLIFPHPSLIGLSLLIAFVAVVWYQEKEIIEEMMAVFFLCYSIRIFTCLRSKRLAI